MKFMRSDQILAVKGAVYPVDRVDVLPLSISFALKKLWLIGEGLQGIQGHWLKPADSVGSKRI
jgi:hypothetical protein